MPTLIKDGVPIDVPEADLGMYLTRGYEYDTPEAAAIRSVTAAREADISGLETASHAFASGASLGLTDVAARALGTDAEYLNAVREANPDLYTGFNLAGQIAPALLSGGSSIGAQAARSSVAGAVSRFGSNIAARGGVGRALVGGAAEGALQNTGSYISDVALGRKELAADAFTAAMGEGALWGGGAAGALSIGAHGVQSLRKLIPEATPAIAQKAASEAREVVAKAVQENDSLIAAAKQRMTEIRVQQAEMSLATKAELDQIAIAKSREIADAQIASAQARSEAQIARAQSPRVRSAKVADEVVPPASVAPAVTDDAATLLERQLLGTQRAIDAGQDLGSISRGVGTVDDALNAHIAKSNPEMAALMRATDEAQAASGTVGSWLEKYGAKGNVGKFERGQAARDTAESWRSATPTSRYVARTGSEAQGAGVTRSRSWEWRGSDADRALADEKTFSRVGDRAEIDAYLDAKRGPSIADDIVESAEARAATTADEKISEAVGGKVDDLGAEANEAIDTIGRMEAAQADLVDALGPAAPPAAAERAAALRAAQDGAERSTAQAGADVAADAQKAADTISLGDAKASGMAGKAMSALSRGGELVEALQMMGLPVPDISRIPIIGPVLSAVLRAKLAMKVIGRGGTIPRTAESVIAGKSAEIQRRVFAAVDTMLDGTSKGMAKAAGVVGGPAAALGHTLFKSDEERPKGKDLGSLFLARSAEVNAALAPGAIRDAVRDRVRASDAAVVDAITAAQERKLTFLGDKMPRPTEPAGLLDSKRPWVPGKEQIAQWARYVEAAENPVAVLERVAAGGTISAEGVETLKKVYPELYAVAQERLMARAIDKGSEVPAARRTVLSVLFDLPTGRSTNPQYMSFLQEGYKAKATPPAPPQPGVPPTPTISADVNLGLAYAPSGPLGE